MKHKSLAFHRVNSAGPILHRLGSGWMMQMTSMLKPDITVVCDDSKIHTKGCVGVPDLVVEVLSPSTALKDKRVKLKRYRLSGVLEYWIVDPSNQIVEVYRLSENVFTEPQVYGKDETVTVGIFGDLEINLYDIFE